MAISVVDICNLALTHIGEKGNVSSVNPTDGSTMGDACSTFYPISLATILDRHPWNFASKRATLAELPDEDASPYLHAFALPNDCRRVLKLEPLPADWDCLSLPFAWDNTVRFMEAYESLYEVVVGTSGQVLLSNAENVRIKYIVNDPKPSTFSAPFIDALAWHLAAQLVGQTVREDTSFNMVGYCLRMYETAFAQAAQADSRQKRYGIFGMPLWISGR